MNKEISALESKLVLKRSEVIRYEDYILGLNDEMENEKRLVIVGIEVDSMLADFCVTQKNKGFHKQDISCFFEASRILIQHIKEIENTLSCQSDIIASVLETLKLSLRTSRDGSELLNDKKDVLLKKIIEGKENLNGLLKVVSAFDESFPGIYFIKATFNSTSPFSIFKHFSNIT